MEQHIYRCQVQGCSFQVAIDPNDRTAALQAIKEHRQQHGLAPPKPLSTTPQQTPGPDPVPAARMNAEVAEAIAQAVVAAVRPLYDRVESLAQAVQTLASGPRESQSTGQQVPTADSNGHAQTNGTALTGGSIFDRVMALLVPLMARQLTGGGAASSPLSAALGPLKESFSFIAELTRQVNEMQLAAQEYRASIQKELLETMKMHQIAGMEPENSVDRLLEATDRVLTRTRALRSAKAQEESSEKAS